MSRCRVAGLDDIKPGELLQVQAGRVPVCLARLASGQVYAISDICSHEQIDLSDGDLQGHEVECPAHGSRFDVITGAVNGLPAEESVATFPVTVDGGDIYVDVAR